MKINPTYVTFEQAKLLKEKGFNIWVQKHYDGYVPDELRCSNGFKMPRCSPQTPEFDYMSLDQVYYAPEQWQVIEWLRIEKGIWIEVTAYDVEDDIEQITDEIWHFKCDVMSPKNRKNHSDFVKDKFNTPQEAYSAAIDYTLNNLI